MDSELLSILFVLDSSPQSGATLAFFNSYLDFLIDFLSDKVKLTLFFPEFSDTEEHFSLNILFSPKYKQMITYIPTRFNSFRETYFNEKMEDVFKYILKEEHFDSVHIWSFKNHSLNYPFIAKERGIPVVCALHDGFLFSNSIFKKGSPLDMDFENARISNFVNSSVASFIKKFFFNMKNPDGRSYWFENIGRYSKYYNRAKTNGITASVFNERVSLAEEAVKFSDKFLFFSETEYNLFYRLLIPESKVVFLEQGIVRDGVFENRTFEIEGAVKFGFMGEILPEEGVLDLIDAFNILYAEGYQNELRIYGETHENGAYFSRLRKRVKNSNLFFNGPIQPGRINSALAAIDVLIIPARWYRNDAFLANSALSARKAIIVSDKNEISLKVKKFNRGLVLSEINPQTIAEAVSELERNRKRLYYFMRDTNDFSAPAIEENLKTLTAIYRALAEQAKNSDNLLLRRKFNKKRLERQRG